MCSVTTPHAFDAILALSGAAPFTCELIIPQWKLWCDEPQSNRFKVNVHANWFLVPSVYLSHFETFSMRLNNISGWVLLIDEIGNVILSVVLVLSASHRLFWPANRCEYKNGDDKNIACFFFTIHFYFSAFLFRLDGSQLKIILFHSTVVAIEYHLQCFSFY